MINVEIIGIESRVSAMKEQQRRNKKTGGDVKRHLSGAINL